MATSPLQIIQDAMIQSLDPDRSIQSVLVSSKLWLGFLLQLDLSGSYEDLKKITWLDGCEIVSIYMDRVKNSSRYSDEFSFQFRKNDYIDDVRVILGPRIV